MQSIRKIGRVDGSTMTIDVPDEFRNHDVEIVVRVLDGNDLNQDVAWARPDRDLRQEPEAFAGSGWTRERNDRRVALIDKMIQESLSAEEARELDSLTARLRLHADNEDAVPIEGARRLHRQLLERSRAEVVPE